MPPATPTMSDEQLLLSGEPEDFGRFYDRHVHSVLGYFARRTGDAELAADLTAETFAAALSVRGRFRARAGSPAVAWLFGIAQHKLADARRRGAAEDRARRRLGMERMAPGADDLDRIAMLGREVAAELIGHLPPDQRAAVSAHILEDEPYGDIAAREQISEALARKRVSRGLKTLRNRMEARR